MVERRDSSQQISALTPVLVAMDDIKCCGQHFSTHSNSITSMTEGGVALCTCCALCVSTGYNNTHEINIAAPHEPALLSHFLSLSLNKAGFHTSMSSLVLLRNELTLILCVWRCLAVQLAADTSNQRIYSNTKFGEGREIERSAVVHYSASLSSIVSFN